MPAVDIVLIENFSALSLTLLTEPMRVANRELARPEWTWRLLSPEGGAVFSSSGYELATVPLDAARSDIILLLSSYEAEAALTGPLLDWLRRKAREGAILGCVDTGAMIFAEAGLLQKTPAAVHFEALRGYREKYADQLFVDRLFDVSDRRCSSAGGVATFDMMLGLIERENGRDLARCVAEVLTYRPVEVEGPQQSRMAETGMMRLDKNLGRAVEVMLANLQEPIEISEIATRIGVPNWTLARLFKRYLKQTPSDYYRHLRLTQARNLLRNSRYRVNEIGSLCGFENPESFARAYKRQFGVTASQDRG